MSEKIEAKLARRSVPHGVSATEMEARFFDLSIDMLCFLGFGGHFARLNPAWERTLGFTREELMSRPFIEFVHPDDRVRTLEQNGKVRSGEQALGFENRYICKDGSYTGTQFSHGICPSCMTDVVEPDLERFERR